MKIILDTSFIVSALRVKIDIFSQLNEFSSQIEVPIEVIDELKKLSENARKLKDRDLAKLALQLLATENYTSVKLNEENVDKGIVKFLKAKRAGDYALATQDIYLKKRAGKKARILSIKARKKIDFV